MKVCIGIPCYKAQKTIEECLSSINFQTMRDDIRVVLSVDNPEDDYEYTKKLFPKLNIEILKCEKNMGVGVARSKVIKQCKDEWIAFIDADDVFYNPYAIENMYNQTNKQGVIQVQSIFVQPFKTPQGIKFYPHKEPTHPWCFARLTNVKFLQDNEIDFGELRAMEDGEFEWKIRLMIEGTQLQIAYTDDIAYVWKEGSEHSITRTGIVNNVPQYNFDLCQIGANIASKHAIDFARKKNPFNGNINKFIVEQMVGHYFTYIECVGKRKEFAEQNLWLGKYFYHECFKSIESLISEELLTQMYTMMNVQKSRDLVGIIPCITFYDWWNKIKQSDYSIKELIDIRSKFSKEVLKVALKTGLGTTEDITRILECSK